MLASPSNVVVMAGLLATYVLAAVAASGGLLPQCANVHDYGWPRFQNRQQLQDNSKWAAYFAAVYGELPTKYPVCVYDFGFINREAYIAAGLNNTRPLVPPTNVSEGDLFLLGNLGGVQEYHIYHQNWTPAPNHTWVELSHAVLPTELSGMWTWFQRGSGIWMNVGRTLVFPTPADPLKTHAAAIAYLRSGCSMNISYSWPQMESDVFGFCAREKGFDSIQFAPQDGQAPTGTFGLTGLTEIVFSRIDGDKTCGVADGSATPLRSGWAASRECKCKNEPIDPDCGLMAFPPPGIVASPPLCQAQAKNHSVACNGYKCGVTKCNL